MRHREKNYSYQLRRHVGLLNRKEWKYCRSANSILPFNPRRCFTCPLWDQEARAVGCLYYDLETPVELSAKEEKDRTMGMIKMGLSQEYPDFIGEDNWPESAEIYERALQFAAMAHKRSYRKGTKIPYIVHPVEVSGIVLQILSERNGGSSKLTEQDYEIAAAAALHDVVEDTRRNIHEIDNEFGHYIAELVRAESEDKREHMDEKESWKIRKIEFLQHLRHAPFEAMVITLGDKLSNMYDLVDDYQKLGDAMWAKFNQSDKKEQKWYYRSIAEELKELQNFEAYKTYISLCDILFNEVEDTGIIHIHQKSYHGWPLLEGIASGCSTFDAKINIVNQSCDINGKEYNNIDIVTVKKFANELRFLKDFTDFSKPQWVIDKGIEYIEIYGKEIDTLFMQHQHPKEHQRMNDAIQEFFNKVVGE